MSSMCWLLGITALVCIHPAVVCFSEMYLGAILMIFIYTPPEPTDNQLVKGVKAMRLFVTKNSVADFRLGYMAALAADTQLRSEVERVRRETVEACAKVCKEQDGVHDEIYAAAIMELLK